MEHNLLKRLMNIIYSSSSSFFGCVSCCFCLFCCAVVMFFVWWIKKQFRKRYVTLWFPFLFVCEMQTTLRYSCHKWHVHIAFNIEETKCACFLCKSISQKLQIMAETPLVDNFAWPGVFDVVIYLLNKSYLKTHMPEMHFRHWQTFTVCFLVDSSSHRGFVWTKATQVSTNVQKWIWYIKGTWRNILEMNNCRLTCARVS